MCASHCNSSYSGPPLRREFHGQSSWSIRLVYLRRLRGLLVFIGFTLTVSLAAYSCVRDSSWLRTLSPFILSVFFPRCQFLEVCLALSLHQIVVFHLHAHDLHSDTCHPTFTQKVKV